MKKEQLLRRQRDNVVKRAISKLDQIIVFTSQHKDNEEAFTLMHVKDFASLPDLVRDDLPMSKEKRMEIREVTTKPPRSSEPPMKWKSRFCMRVERGTFQIYTQSSLDIAIFSVSTKISLYRGISLYQAN